MGKAIKVYRLEHRDTLEGPFRARDAYHYDEWGICTAECFKHHDGPRDTNNGDYYIEWMETHTSAFAWNTLRKCRGFIKDECIGFLVSKGYVINVYKVNVWIPMESGGQIIIDRDYSNYINTIELVK